MKKIITMAVTAAMVASLGTAAFANEGDDIIVQGDLTTMSDAAPVNDDAQSMRFTASEGTKSEIDEDTVIFDIEGNKKELSDVKEDDNLIIFLDGEKAAYAVIKSEESITNVMIDLFTKSETLGDFVDTQNNLSLNISEETDIADLDGNKTEDIDGKYLMVFYDITTMSIPAITNPVKIIVLNEEAAQAPEATPEMNIEPIETVYDYKMDIDSDDIITSNNVNLIPVRKYAEGLGLEVTWNGDDMSVTIGTIPMGVMFKIGENSYSKSRMTPFVLEQEPVLINDTTYVPVSFFKEVLNTQITYVMD